MAHVCRSAYDETLAHHHPWYVRKGVHVAVYALPHRKQLLIDLSGTTADKYDEVKADNTLVELVNGAEVVYDRIQKLYADKGILNLP
uniref:Glycolipid transfer protein domain-containing protein n=1 Tax=Plectus sambesii TaxID=2011161 RepID=A0A914VDP0_9BILA